VSYLTENRNDAERSRRKDWYAIHIKSRTEFVVSHLLTNKGYQTVLPIYKKKKRLSDRTKEVDVPLFPGYLFSFFDVRKRLPILKTPGVLRIVGIGKKPVAVEQQEMESILRVLEAGVLACPTRYMNAGSRVLIESGPLSGLKGILLEHKEYRKVVLSITLLQRSIAVEVDEGWVVPG